MIHEGDPGQECLPEGPGVADESPPDRLTRDAAYVGSLALAGVALFGYVLSIPIIKKSDPLSHRSAAAMAATGPFALAGTHIWFAMSMCCTDPGPHVAVDWSGDRRVCGHRLVRLCGTHCSTPARH